MKNFLLAFAVFLVWSFFGLWLYSWLKSDTEANNQVKNLSELTNEDKQISTPQDSLETNVLIDSSAVVKPIKIEDNRKKNDDPSSGLKATTEDGDIVFFYAEGFHILKNSGEISVPGEISNFKYKLNTYFIENPGKEIHIFSMYSASENTESPNLGVQRGNRVKEILIRTGIPAKNIVVKPKITEINFYADGSYNNSFAFVFKPLDVDRVEDKNPVLLESRTVYPLFTAEGIQENEALKNLLKEIKAILIENPDITIDVVGHTDNIGNAVDNYRIGLKYAQQMRYYLINKAGINRNKIKAKSEGEAKSIASNNSKRGRIANRRIEIIFQ